MRKNTQQSQHSGSFHERPLVTAVRHALPYVVGLSLALSFSQPVLSRSSDSAAAFTATQLVRQFTLKNTVTQVSLGMQGYVAEVDGQQRGPAMGARPAGFPADMGSVPAGVNLPQRDGAGRPLGYCAWDNNSATSTASYNAGQGVTNPLVYAVVSPGLNGAMQTTCADILANGVGMGDDHVQTTAPMQVSSRQYRTSVGNFSDLQTTPGEEGDIRLVLDTNMLYSYTGGAWEPVQAGPFQPDGTGAISYTSGTVTVADFLAATATLTGAVSADSATFTNGVVASTFTGNGAGLTDLNAANISAGVVSPEFGGTGVNGAAAANGTLLIGNGSGFTLGTLTAGAGISVLNDAGVITVGNSGVLSLTGSADQIIASANNGDVVLSLPQAIATTSTPTFGGLLLNGDLIGTTATFSGAVSALSVAGDGSALTDLNAGNFASGTLPVVRGGTGVDGSAAANGQLLIGNGTGYTLSTLTAGDGIGIVNGAGSITLSNTGVTSLTGTANRVNVSAATGAVTLSLPQDIHTLSDVTFGSLRVRKDAQIGAQGAYLQWNRGGANGRTFLINQRGLGSGGISFGEATAADVYTENMFLSRTGNLTVSGSVSALSFAGDGSALTDLNAGNFTSGTLPVARGGTGVDGSAAANGQLLIGNGTGYTLSTLTAGAGIGIVNGAGSITLSNTGVTSLAGTANQVTVSAATGAVTLSLPQDIGTESNVEFGTLNVTQGNAISSKGAYLQWNRPGSGGQTYLINQRGLGAGGISFGEATAADVYTQNMFLSRFGDLTVTGSITANDGINSTTGAFSGAVSAQRLNVADSSGGVTVPNIIIGTAAMTGAQSGDGGNTAVGINALQANTTGGDNSAFAQNALMSNTTGNRNQAFGVSALASNTEGSKNSAFGADALRANTTGNSNVAVGTDALDRNTTGYDNQAVGVNALLFNTTGYENLAIGNDALRNQTIGHGNVGVGKDALRANTSGTNNTALGRFAGDTNTTGSNNTFVGYNADTSAVALTYAGAIGADSSVATSNTLALGRASATDQVVIGASSRTGTHKLYVEGTALVTGGVTTTSDSRLKTNVQQLDHDSMLEKLGQISAYRYNYINLPQAGKKVGVIAQEIQTLFPEVANYGNGDQFLSVDYAALGAMAAVGVGQLNIKYKALSTKVDEQGTLITALDEKLSGVDTRVASLETWKIEAVGRMDGFQTAIDANVKKIAENALAIQGNTSEINRLDDVLVALDGTVKANSESINSLNVRWGNTFSASEDGSLLTVLATELKVSNFTAQQIRSTSAYTLRLEAEMAAIRELEVDSLKANTAVANSVQAKQVNTGASQVYAGVGAPAFLFAAPSDGHYTVNTSAMDGSYATATVIVNAGQAKVVPIASEGIELMAVGNSVKAIAAGKSIRASWIKTG